MKRERGRISSEAAAGLLTLAAYLPFLLLRTLIAGGGNPARLSLIGTAFSNRRELPSFLPTISGSGYDGQFFLRFALNPFDLARTAYGITLDVPFRAQRIGYPFLSWLLSFGNAHLVPLSLIAVNIAAVTTIAWAAARLARGSARPVLTGLAASTFFGYAMSTGRDLSEPTAAALALVAMNLFEENRNLLAGLAFAAATLTLETELVIPIAIGIVWLFQQVRRYRGPIPRLDTRILPWLIPGAVALAWQLTLSNIEHTFPAASDLSGNLGVPVVTVLAGISAHLNQISLSNLIWFGQLAVLAAMTALALSSLRSPAVPPYLKVALVLMLLLVISISGEVWNHSSYFRAFDLLWLIAVITWMRSRPRLPAIAAIGPLAWLASAIPLILFL